MAEKNGNKSTLKTVLIIVTIFSGFVGTYFTTASSMKTEMALIKQKSDLEISFLKYRITKLESANPEKLEGRVDALQTEVETAAKHSKIIENLLEKLLE